MSVNRAQSGYYGNGKTSCEATMKVPVLTGTSGAVAFWTGIGDSSGRLQQAGITCTRSGAKTVYKGFCENYPNPPRPVTGIIEAGNTMRFAISRDGTEYKMTVENVTRKWTVNLLSSAEPADDYYSFTSAEEYTDTLAEFEPVTFTDVAPDITTEYTGIAGVKLVRYNGTSFSISR